MPNPIVNRRVVVSGGYDASAAAYFARLEGSVSPAVKTLVNNLVVTLKDDGNWPYIDHLPLMNMPNEQNAMVNLKSPSDPLMVNYNSCVHTPYIGIQGNGTTAYIDTNYNPSTYGGNYTRDSASSWVFSNTSSLDTGADLGAFNGTDCSSFIRTRQAGDLTNTWQNTSGASVYNTYANNDAKGLFMPIRKSAILEESYKDGILKVSGAWASVPIINLNIYLLAGNYSGSANSFSSHQLSIAGCGSGQINPATFNTAITTFVNAMAAL